MNSFRSSSKSIVVLLLLLVWLYAFSSAAQTLNLPPRPADAPSGSAFAASLVSLAGPVAANNRNISAREAAICGEILRGNVPNWMRQLTLITTNAVVKGTNYTVSYYVTPDYLAIGSDTNYFLTPMTPLLGQYLADKLNCTLPTAKMVNNIWSKAPCKLAPSPISPSAEMITVPVFIDHNTTVRGQRFAVTNAHPLGTLVGGTKKDVVIANRIYTNFASQSITTPVVIYGWHRLNGERIQGVYNGHEETYVDYSHSIRLVQMNILVNGQPNTVTNVLTNPNLAGILSDDTIYPDNVIPVPRYPTFNPMAPILTTKPVSQATTPGSTVVFQAFAIGDGQLSYQWKRNGTNLPGATGAALELANVQTNDAGTYTVTVTSSLGSASASAILSLSSVRFESIQSTTNGIELTLSGDESRAYILNASTNLLSWEPISVLSVSNGIFPFFDPEAFHFASRYYKAAQTSLFEIANFESTTTGNGSLFMPPISSGSTTQFLNLSTTTFAYVTNNLPPGNSSTNALFVGWTFNPTPNGWLRLTTFNAPQHPNPTVGIQQTVFLDIYSDQEVYVALGLRETGTDAAIGANGGSSGTIEWVGTTSTTPPRGKLVPANQWTTLYFWLPREPVRQFTGNGVLESNTGKVVLEHLAITPKEAGMQHRIYIDNVRAVDFVP